jgi:cell wall-associated NlpC family hydrolase
MSDLDKRLHAVRPDLADARLRGRCNATTFAVGTQARCIVPATAVRSAPAADAMQLTQVLFGETLNIFERANGWAWVQLLLDGYVGYIHEAALGDAIDKTTHCVSTRSTHLYPKPDLKTHPALPLPMNSMVSVTGGEGDYLALSTGQYVFADHVSAAPLSDFVSVAELFLHTPYLWGGKTVWGIDCSGLVQVSLHACGKAALRDSDMQEQSLGQLIAREFLQRGDLVFWKGHVGIMQDADILLHANGHHMKVVSEPLRIAVERIAAKGSKITNIKRL